MQSPPVDLDAISIASPCTVPWDSMNGDAVKRFCGQCRLHVHDVSRMSRQEVGDLLQATGGTCCLRVWRRADGRVITKDCQRIRRALRRRMQTVSAAAAGLLALLGIGGCQRGRAADSAAGTAAPVPAPAATETPTMGIAGMPPPTPRVPAVEREPADPRRHGHDGEVTRGPRAGARLAPRREPYFAKTSVAGVGVGTMSTDVNPASASQVL